MSLRRLILLGVLLWLALVPSAAWAHKVPPEVVAFFKVDGARLRVVVRVPTAILLDARMPMKETVFLDVANLDPSLRTIGAEVIRSLDVTDNGRPLAAGAPQWRLTPFADKAGARAFASFETASTRFGSAAPVPGDAVVYWNEAWVDYQFDYALPAAGAQVEARLNGLRMGGDFFQTTATYLPVAGAPRTVTVSGPPQRVRFEPTTAQALSVVLRQGVDRIINERLLWWFVLCLAIPRRRLSEAVPSLTSTGAAGPFAAFALAQVGALVAVSARAAAIGDVAWDVTQFIAGGAVILAAVQVLLASGPVANAVAAAIFGAASGVILGTRLHELLPLAGSHPVVVRLVFVLFVTGAIGLLLAVLSSLVPYVYRVKAPAWLVTAALAALPAHEAAHQAMDAAGRLGGLETWTLPPALGLLVTHWPTLALLAFFAAAWLASLAGRTAPVSDGGPQA